MGRRSCWLPVWSALPDLLPELIAEGAVLTHVAEIREECSCGDEQPDQENPAAALVGEAAHLAEADGDEESGEGGQDGERRKRIAVDCRFEDQPCRGGGGEDGDYAGPVDARSFRWLLLNADCRWLFTHVILPLARTRFCSPAFRPRDQWLPDSGFVQCSSMADEISVLPGQCPRVRPAWVS